jgi:tight adherence protein C
MRAAAQAVAARLPPRVVAELCPPATVRRLDAAGRPGGLGVAEVAGTRVLAAVAGAMLAVAMAGLGAGPRAVAVWMLAGAVGGPLLIEGRLARLARLRAAAIDEAMPDFADLVSVCVEAGMGIDEALDRVGGRADGPLAVELARYGAERRLGATSERALGSLGDRAGSDALAAFCGALCQSATLGVPIAETLRAQAVDQRLRRRQRAQDRAHRAAPKLQLVIAFLILPGVLVLVFGTIVLGAIAAGGPAW